MKRFLFKILVLVPIFTLVLINGHGQNAMERNIEMPVGVNTEVDMTFYSAIDGKMWFSSPQGNLLYSYDGFKTNTYSVPLKANENGKFNIQFESAVGKWYVDGSKISLFDISKKWHFYHSPNITGMVDENSKLPFTIDKTGRIDTFSSSNRIFVPSNYFYQKPNKKNLKRFSSYSLESVLTYRDTITNNFYYYKVNKDGSTTQLNISSDSSWIADIFIKGGYYRLSNQITKQKYFYNLHDSLYKISSNKVDISEYMNGYILGIEERNNTRSEINLVHFDSNHQNIYQNIRKNYLQNTFRIDHYGHLWYGTGSGPVVRYPEIMEINENAPNMVSSIHTIAEDSHGRIWFGGYENAGFSYWDGEKLSRPNDTRLRSSDVLPGSYTDIENDRILFIANKLSVIKDGKNISLGGATNENVTGFIIKKLKSGYAMGTASKGLRLFNIEGNRVINDRFIKKGLTIENILTLTEDKVGRIWMGRASQGIAVYDPKIDSCITWLRTETGKDFGATSSDNDNEDNLWLGTTDGLYIVNHVSEVNIYKESIFDRAKKILLPGNDRSNIGSIIEHDKFMIMSSLQGVHFVYKNLINNSNRPKTYSLWFGKELPKTQGEQNCIHIDKKGYLWVGTQSGVLRFDLKKMYFDTTSAKLSNIRIITCDTLIVGEDHIYRCKKGERDINITWEGSSTLALSNAIFYDIYVVNSGGDTIKKYAALSDPSILVDNLAPDTYVFQLLAYKNNILADRRTFTVEIPKYWTESILFWMLIILAILSLPILYIYNKQQKEKLLLTSALEKEKNQRQIDELKIKNLSNYFNPHFINNALHWMQSKYRKDPDATVLIGRMADNIERIYNNTEKGKHIHLLSEELKIVENYLMMCKIRYGTKISFTITNDIGSDVDTYYVPTMILQILVENGIEKGIANNHIHGHLMVQVSESSTNIAINVIDDGRGRMMDDELPTFDRKSSTKVMNDLVAIYNIYNEQKMSVAYEDTYLEPDENYPHKHGTKVIVTIPKEFRYDI